MQINSDHQMRMERAHVLAWPALTTAVIDGWLWRSSGGGSQRANSVSTIEFTAPDPAAAIKAVEARYTALGKPSRFQTYDRTAPAGLDTMLRNHGYADGDPTVTMFKPLRSPAAPPGVECQDHPSDEWLEVYLGAITEDRRAVNRKILTAVPPPRAFFGYRQNGRIISTALCVIGFGCAVVECVATGPDARRQGGGRAVMAGLLSWAAGQAADLVGLQVAHGNVPATRLYHSLGFVEGATNQFWLKHLT